MKRLDQGFSSFSLCKMAARCGVVSLAMSFAAIQADDLRKNLVVLVDSSRSVDAANRDSALKLVAGLVSGKVDETCRAHWVFKPAATADYPVATINLQRLMQGSGEPTQPIALDAARLVINALGNYSRVATLREQLAQARMVSPEQIAGMLLEPAPPFESSDNSTHISLAEAVVAKSFLASSSAQPYYLVVISDFHEDCFNKAISEYLDKTKNAALQVENLKVFTGEKKFDDGKSAENTTYSSEDVAAIRYLEQKTKDLLLGEFVYKGVPMPAAPVNVKVYSPMVKRGFKFATEAEQRWILPDPPPSFAIQAEGMDMTAPLEIKFVNRGNQSEQIIKETCGFVLARNRLDLGVLMERPEVLRFMTVGEYDVLISAPQPIGLDIKTKVALRILKPEIIFDDAGLQKSTEKAPFEFAVNKEIRDEKIIIRLDPAPTKTHKVVLEMGGNSTSIEMANGSGEGALGNLLENASGDDAFKLTASLELAPTAEVSRREAWLKLPEISLWAEYEGERVKGDVIPLEKVRAVTLKASHVGMEGMDWRGTKVESGGMPAKSSTDGSIIDFDVNNLDFSDLAAGEYTVSAKFGSARNPKEKQFSVIVPKPPNWMLYALIAMVVVSLSLFGWHFFRR